MHQVLFLELAKNDDAKIKEEFLQGGRAGRIESVL